MRFLIVVGILLSLVGCGGIEYRSESLIKTPLTAIQEKVSANKLWSKNIGTTVNKFDANLVVTMRNGALVVSDSKGLVTCINAKTGKTLWQQKLARAITSGAQLADNKVLLTTAAQLIVLSAKNGSKLWQTKLSSVALAAPIAYKSAIYVHTVDGSLSAFDARNGRKLWAYNALLPEITLRHASQPVIYHDYVVTGFASGKLVALRRTDGTVAWEVMVKQPGAGSEQQRMLDISANPVVFGDYIYVVGYNGNLLAVDANGGTVAWEREIASVNGMAVANKVLFVADPQGQLWSVHRKSGTVAWKQNALYGRQLGKPTFFKNTVVVADTDGMVHWINGKDGSLVGRLQVSKHAISAPLIISKGILYVLSSNGVLSAYKLQLNAK